MLTKAIKKKNMNNEDWRVLKVRRTGRRYYFLAFVIL